MKIFTDYTCKNKYTTSGKNLDLVDFMDLKSDKPQENENTGSIDDALKETILTENEDQNHKSEIE